ncbi:MAG: Gfo/Idh/MocA family protein [Phycisphaerae bacterium]
MRILPNRRQFLRRAAALTAAPLFIPAAALGTTRRTAASSRIGVAVIGIKKMGSGHVDTLLGFPDVQIIAVCDVDKRARDAMARKCDEYYARERGDDGYRAVLSINEYESLLARSDVDAVVIATPDHWHAIIAVHACRAGKDVYCEKPLSLTVRDGRRMVDAARRYGRVFQIGTQQRSAPEFRHAVELVRNGYIGKLQRVHVECGGASWDQDWPAQLVPDGFDFDRWLGPAPLTGFHEQRIGSNFWDGWRRFRDYSGGKMTDWGAHHYDIVQWALGADAGGPVEVAPPRTARAADLLAFRPTKVQGPGSDPTDPSWGLTMRYANGVEVVKDHNNGILFVGSEGRVEVNRGYIATTPTSLKTLRFKPTDERVIRSDNHHQNWLTAIRTRTRPVSDVEAGHRSATACHLGNIALWTGRTIRWNAATEQIETDEVAARLLDRTKRWPYTIS